MTGRHGHERQGGRGGKGAVSDRLLVRVDSPVHRLPAQVKLAAVLLFVLGVVLAPREQLWAPLAAAALLGVAVTASRVPMRVLAPRLVVELPFVGLTVLLPFVTPGERVDVLGVGLSLPGLYAAWGVLTKATLAALAVLLLTATTPLRDVLTGLERLGLPRLLVLIATSMVRYVDVLTTELARMRIARLSRGEDPRWLWQVRGLAATAGALFVRSYERGERVHVAMLSRGWTGTAPAADRGAAVTRRQWAVGLSLPALGGLVAAVAWVAQWNALDVLPAVRW